MENRGMRDSKKTEYIDSSQNANALIHCMEEFSFLETILCRKRLVPRYCPENVDYIGIEKRGKKIEKVLVMEKCFCDIPLHQLGLESDIIIQDNEGFSDDEVEKMKTHTGLYGEYAIAFEKEWGLKNNIQPVQYINNDSYFINEYRNAFEYTLENRTDEVFVDNIINQLAFFKPVKGIMQRKKGNNILTIEKNFCDEQEWRFVPGSDVLDKYKIPQLIAKDKITSKEKSINNSIESRRYSDVWLKFKYDDIKYIIVPSSAARVKLISVINDIDENNFENDLSIELQKDILKTKILVLDDIRKDW